MHNNIINENIRIITYYTYLALIPSFCIKRELVYPVIKRMEVRATTSAFSNVNNIILFIDKLLAL